MSENISDIEVTTIKGQKKTMGDYAGKVLLIVNVASACGYTPQYAGLEELYEEYRDKGLEVLGFPCNDFGGQEPGDAKDILACAVGRFGAQFDIFEKVHAIGTHQHPLFARLTGAFEPKEDIRWNFEKFLIDKQGDVIAWFKSSVEPGSEKLLNAVEEALA